MALFLLVGMGDLRMRPDGVRRSAEVASGSLFETRRWNGQQRIGRLFLTTVFGSLC